MYGRCLVGKRGFERLVEYIVWLWFEECIGILCGCNFEDWLGVLFGCGGHVIFGSLLYVMCGDGSISLKNSMERWKGWVFCGLKFWFELINFFIFTFFTIFPFLLFC